MAKNPTPLVYIRALVKTYLFRPDVFPTSWDEGDLLDQDLSILVLPASRLIDPSNAKVEAIHDDRHFIVQEMNNFRRRVIYLFTEVHRTWCHNRPRARRALTHLLWEWDVVQHEVEDIDARILERLREVPFKYDKDSVPSFSFPLSSWARYYKLKVMGWIVHLGFELEIYQPDELAGMYYYLNILARLQSSHLERTKSFTLRDLSGQQRKSPSGLCGVAYDQFMCSLKWLHVSIIEASITWELSDALSTLYAVLMRLKLLKVPPRPYGSNELRYELRMRPWNGLSFPALQEYADFKKEWERGESSTEELLAHAEKAVAHAKKGFEVMTRLKEDEKFAHGCVDKWNKWYKDCQRAGILAGITVSAVKSAYSKAVEARRRKKSARGESESRDKNGEEEDVRKQDFSMGAEERRRREENPEGEEELGISIEVLSPRRCYHPWWIVPITTVKR